MRRLKLRACALQGARISISLTGRGGAVHKRSRCCADDRCLRRFTWLAPFGPYRRLVESHEATLTPLKGALYPRVADYRYLWRRAISRFPGARTVFRGRSGANVGAKARLLAVFLALVWVLVSASRKIRARGPLSGVLQYRGVG